MTPPRSDLLHFLAERGHNPECSDAEGLEAELKKGVVTGYIGFDPTARSLHIGNMAQLMFLRRLQMAGHRPIALVGGATGKIPDPSGRNDMRKTLSDDQLSSNVASIKSGLSRFITFDNSSTGAIMVDNNDWLGGLGYIEMLQLVGQHFSINRMLAMDSVKNRLEREVSMTFLEFNYMIMQGYDFVVLREKFGCLLQMGGSDQWGNIVQGIELGRRMKGYSLFGIHQPLLTTASGEKMGKSMGNAVWINADMLSPYDFWQYWRNAEDSDVGRWLRIFTDLSLDEVKRLEALGGSEINEAKKVLATEVTALVHGREEAEKAAKTAQETFEQGQNSEGLQTFKITAQQLETLTVVECSVMSGLVSTNSEAKRLITQGGLRLNDAPITDLQKKISYQDFIENTAKLSKGKKDHRLIKIG